MKPPEWIGALLLMLILGGQGLAGPGMCEEPPRPGFLQWVAPAGGWFPYGGGLLHWWDPHCFPRCGGPDDYCRKPLPHVCWPPYPPYYLGGPPPICPPQQHRPSDCHNPPGEPARIR